MEREGCGMCRCLMIPGMCFDPSDEQLLAFYLTQKIEGRPLQCNHLITELQIYHDDLMPWEIIKDDNPYWITSSTDSSNKNKIKKTIYVFTELRKKISRVIRRSGRGSWTGQNNPIVKNKTGVDIGYNKLLTFYKDSDGKKGRKKKILDDDQEHGHWMMHEYSLFGIENYVLCKIIKEVSFSAKASVLCPTKAAVPTQDFHTQGDGHIMNVVLEDQERQSGGGDQTLDVSTTDWDKNRWMEELYKEFGMNSFDGQDDNNMKWNNQIPDFLVEEEAIAVVNQPSDYSGADLDLNGQNSVLREGYGTADDHNGTAVSHDTSAGVGVVKGLPVVGVIDNHQQGQVIQDISSEETVAGLQDRPVAVWGKNGQGDGSYKGLDGSGNHNIIILDDESNGVHDGQQSMMTEAINVDNQVDNDMEGYNDDFWNGLDVLLDFSSPDLFDLWPDEFNKQSCSIIEGQPGKRMRYGVEDCDECPSGKKQRCL
ncbi:hypothetical protein POM88_037533 [Heracleum sosnowskyi]|uniref:NAC domain-containing protein n=1 Tax=Heracleum sosnowskyi TaxID=360622 RepID=A0AAD8HRB5_9APIA|nr:hypothetical protein POM88_037533 [Heracleum sosnowskyi]